ncbi:hypothetical protein KE530_04395 [Clostridiaceae bacterium Marseille-Q4145]|nr:hypothetical protein [Clostridiaceae bacterium Marseille-Q4145]
MTNLVHEIEQDEDKYKGQSILNIVENMKYDCIEKVVTDFCLEWYGKEDIIKNIIAEKNLNYVGDLKLILEIHVVCEDARESLQYVTQWNGL